MKIKRYLGYTAHEAMGKMKRELGVDAVILNTRTVKQKGLFGFLKKPMVEITAAYENSEGLSNVKGQEESFKRINSELANLKSMVEQLSTNISTNIKKEENEFNSNLMDFKLKLVNNGVEDGIATKILNKLNQQIDFSTKDNLSIRNILKKVLVEYIGKPKPIDLVKGYQKIIFFIGPTGVGKTTTLAKIAAQMVMEKECNIGLITSDTYRIAAVEQIKVYSEILNVPLQVIYNEEDMYSALVQLEDKDLIFVDTTGRSHRTIREEDELFRIINSIKNKEIYLVLSSTTDFPTLKSVINKYNFLDDYRIIFTKIDEAERLGNILNIRYLTNKPISYVTNGQNVPDDIEIMDSEKVVDCLLGEI